MNAFRRAYGKKMRSLKDQGYTLSYKPWKNHDPSKDALNYHYVTAHDPTGNRVGYVEFSEVNGVGIPHGTQVDPAHQRKGIASAMYSHYQKMTGHKLQPDEQQSDEAKALWAQQGRPFGKLEKNAFRNAFPLFKLYHKTLSDGSLFIEARHRHEKDDTGGPLTIGHLHVQNGVSSDAHVSPDHQRKGVANAMYQYAEKRIGDRLQPSDTQSPAGKALWNQPNRPFGNLTTQEVHSHFLRHSKDKKPNMANELQQHGQHGWKTVDLSPSQFGDDSDKETSPSREKQAVAYSKLRTRAPHIIARQMEDGTYEALDGRRRVRAAALNGGTSTVRAYVPIKKSELAKMGAMRRRAPYNPKAVPEKERYKAASWMTDQNRESRDQLQDLQEIAPEAKVRALHQLSGKTKVRLNPETKEREFLLHRGPGPLEAREYRDQKRTDGLTSWTPKVNLAVSFANDHWHGARHDSGDYFKEIGVDPIVAPHLASAWIPESQIHHAPRMIEPREGPGDETYSGEHEIIVKPHRLKDLTLTPNPETHQTGMDVDSMINARAKGNGIPTDPYSTLATKWKASMKQRLGKSELAKGAIRRLHGAYDPAKELPDPKNVANWVGGNGSRDKIPDMSAGGKARATNKLMQRAKWRKNPQSGQREFLLHRQMGGYEFPKAVKDGAVTHDKPTSWTPDLERVKFGIYQPTDLSTLHDYSHIVSAWIPEAHIKNYIPQYGSHAERDGRGPIGNQSEQETIVGPHSSEVHEVHHDDRLKNFGVTPEDDAWDGGDSTGLKGWEWKKIYQAPKSGIPVQNDRRPLRKSPYGPAGMGLYNPADNMRRKMQRASITANKPTASQQASQMAAADKAKSKKNPVKIYTPQEIQKLFRGGFKRPKVA